ncbi:MAG: hypothetical protein ABEJ04_00020, partial [Halobacteriaceae archaeon]
REAVERDGALPASVTVGGDEVGLGSLADALAAGVLAAARGDAPTPVRVRSRPPFPAVADEVAATVPETLAGWVVHRPDLDPERITAHAVRQTWTLAPARR